MKRFVIVTLALLAAACSRAPSNVMQGYGEADYIYLASQESGVLGELYVREGDAVEAGARVFTLDPERLSLNAQSANAQAAAASSAIRTAQAQATLAQANYARGLELFNRGFYPRARLDSDRAFYDAAVHPPALRRSKVGRARAVHDDTVIVARIVFLRDGAHLPSEGVAVERGGLVDVGGGEAEPRDGQRARRRGGSRG